MVGVGHRVPEPRGSLAWLLCLSPLARAAAGRVCCLNPACTLWKPHLPSWKLLQDSCVRGGQVLLPQCVAQPGEGGAEEWGRFRPTLIGFFIYVCVN